MTEQGPVERWLEEFTTTAISDDERNRAIVLDLAGASGKDVDVACEAVCSAYRVSNEWNYFTSVITRRIAERLLLRREMAAEATDPADHASAHNSVPHESPTSPLPGHSR